MQGIIVDLVQDYKNNTPLFMLQNKYGLSGADIIRIIHKVRVGK